MNRQQRRAAARVKKPAGPAGGPIGLPAPDVAEKEPAKTAKSKKPAK